jgi:hypothetical protein
MATILKVAGATKDLSVFVAGVNKSALLSVLRGPGPFTVFAPTDDAFDDLPEGTVNRLLEDAGKLAAILAYHVVPGRFTTADAERLAGAVTTLEGSDLRISAKRRLTVNGAKVVHADLLAGNGVIHAIDRVLVPIDDLGNVELSFTDLTVVEPPETVILVETDESTGGDKPKTRSRRGASSGQSAKSGAKSQTTTRRTRKAAPAQAAAPRRGGKARTSESQ